MQTSLTRAPRPNAGGTITRAGQTTNYAPGMARTQLNPQFEESQAAPPVRTMAPRPAVAPVARSPLTRTPPSTAGMTGFALSNTLNNAGIYAPGSHGAVNAVANGTGYTPPQQTERANPLTGDNNIPVEGQTTAVRAPFIQRGGSVPQGQDAQDSTIGTSMAGTLSRVGGGNTGGNGLFKRSFGSPQAANAYSSYISRLFPASP